MAPTLSFFLLSLLLATLALSAPSPPNLVYPLAAQLPPTARTNQTWSWTLLPGTFNASSGSTLSLSSRNLPTWAQFDANTWTFSGLPNVADVGSQLVTVQANASGVAEGISSVFELLVVDAPLPEVPILFLKPDTALSGPFPDPIVVHKNWQNDQVRKLSHSVLARR